MRHDRGFALLSALWALLIVGVVASAYLAESRHFLRISVNRSAELRARYGALAGLERAHNTLERLQVAVSGPEALRAWNRLDSVLAGGTRECLDDGCYDVEVRGVVRDGRINVNTASAAELDSLPGATPGAVQAILEARRRGVVFADLTDVVKVVPSGTRRRLLDHFAELLRVAVLEPDGVEVTSVGTSRGSGLRVTQRAVLARRPQRLVLVKLWRLTQ